MLGKPSVCESCVILGCIPTKTQDISSIRRLTSVYPVLSLLFGCLLSTMLPSPDSQIGSATSPSADTLRLDRVGLRHSIGCCLPASPFDLPVPPGYAGPGQRDLGARASMFAAVLAETL
jgi:hypothetical protein